MFAKKITTAAVIASGLLFAGNVSAKEISVEKYLGILVNAAFEVTSEEISYGVQEAVLTANNMIGSSKEQMNAKVSIQDLNSDSTAKETSDKAE